MLKYTLFIGIDISKLTFDACIVWSNQQGNCPHCKFEQNEQGYKKLVQWIKKIAASFCPCEKKDWFIYAEHTGIYGLRLAQFFELNQIAYLMDSPLRISRSLGLKRQKDDPTDARDIAKCAMRRDFSEKVRPIPAKTLVQVHTLLSLRARLVRYMRGLETASNELAYATDAIIHGAIQDSTNVVAKTMAQQIKTCEKKIEYLLRSEAELNRLYDLVISVVGIGPIITAYMLVYTNGFTAFDNARQFNCFIGTAPFKYQSGTSIKQKDKVNTMANHKLKALFSMGAITAINHDPQIRNFCNESLNRGKEMPWIYNAVKGKLVKRIFAVVQRNSPYVILGKHLN